MITLEELSKFVRNGKNAQTEIDRLCRTNNSQTSKAAAKRMVDSGELNRQEQAVYGGILGYVRNHTKKDFTTKDIARYWWPATYYNAYDICRKRFSDLEMKNKIKLIRAGFDEKTKKHIWKRRDGCRVWRLL